MRMVHYYLGLALLLLPALFATLLTGLGHDGSQTHLSLGLLTAIGFVATNTLFILFMIVTGRVLKSAMKARSLSAEFLAELNRFFAERKAYPVALLAATIAVTTAVLGYGPLIGVPSGVHLLAGITTVLVHLYVIPLSYRTLRTNQELLDRVARELDRIDREAESEPSPAPDVEWAYGRRTRWLIFAVCAWMPYLYWALVVWHGAFGKVSPVFLGLTALVSLSGFVAAVTGGRSTTGSTGKIS